MWTYNWNCCTVVAVVDGDDKDIVVDALGMHEKDANDDANGEDDDDISLNDDDRELVLVSLNAD